VRRGQSGAGSLALLAALLALWMGPRHKLFEPATALGVGLALTRLLERPDRARHFQAGAATGLALCIGRNHTLYAALALALCLTRSARLARRIPTRRELAAVAAGIALGALPLIALALLAPGYAAAFAENLRFYALHGANHPLPIPWPWRAGALAQQPGTALGMFVEVSAPIALLALLWRPRTAGPASAAGFAFAAVALAYSHHALARADSAHLAQAIPPLLVALALAPAALGSRTLAPHALAALAGFTLLALPEVRPLLIARFSASPAETAPLAIGSREVRVATQQARELGALARAIESRVPRGAALLAAPSLPGLHAWLGRPALDWRSYFLWPASEADERRILAALARSEGSFALIDERAPFGIEALRFARSHPRVEAALERDFDPVATSDLPVGYRLLAKR
jgi:hypothetical protein